MKVPTDEELIAGLRSALDDLTVERPHRRTGAR